jgi:hypothetical protein
VSLAAVLRPGSALLSRLRYAPKFLIIGLALVLPLVYVSWSYTGQQSTQQAFSAKERIGLRYLTPATDVLDQLISARNVAVAAAIDGRPATGTTPELAKAIAAVDAEARDGANLGVSDTWAKLKTSIATATATDGDPRGIYNAYSLTTAAQIRFIVDIGDKSNLILDPDLDS